MGKSKALKLYILGSLWGLPLNPPQKPKTIPPKKAKTPEQSQFLDLIYNLWLQKLSAWAPL